MPDEIYALQGPQRDDSPRIHASGVELGEGLQLQNAIVMRNACYEPQASFPDLKAAHSTPTVAFVFIRWKITSSFFLELTY